MRLRTTWSVLLALFAVVALASGQQSRKGDEPNVRSVEGTVTNAAGQAVEGAVVQMKNTKTLQVRSFITQQDGGYHFHGLSTNADYEFKADHNGATSGSKTLSSFDSRTKAVINLKLEDKK
jgi:hypothetical protein